MRVSVGIPSLFNGVSQQDPTLRLPSQGEAMENGYALIADGLRKRPPTRHVALLTAEDTTGDFFHFINRDQGERYAVRVTNGDLEVYDLFTGSPVSVSFPDGKSYLANAAPATGFSAVTIADHTFIVNRDVYADWNTSGSGADWEEQPNEAYVYVKRAVVSTDYAVTVNGTTVTSTTASTGQPSTTAIADDLATQIEAISGFTASRLGSVIRIIKDDLSDFTFNVYDSYGEQGLVGFKGTIQRFSDLPPRCFDGTRVWVKGEDTDQFDDYYVQYDAVDGVWTETRGWSLDNAIDPYTMPHKLVRQGDGTFTFEVIDWAERLVGDAESAAAPSFIGKTISDIFFFRNRLGFLADENVIMSRNGSFYDFWPETVTQSLATDPIDVAVSHVKVSLLRRAVPFNEVLLLFSDQTQFQLTADQALTPETVKIDQTTEFEASLTARPVGAGPNIYFAVQRGDYSAVREYFVEPDIARNDATDITAHVPRYIPGTITSLSASSTEDLLVALSSTDTDSVYVYKWYWNGKDKLQSCWSRWNFYTGESVMGVSLVESSCYILIKRSDGLYLERIDLQTIDETVGYQVHLDRLCTLTGAYSAENNWTTWTLPYPQATGIYVIKGPAFTKSVGDEITVTRPTSTTVRATGDYSAGICYVGRTYEFRYEFSTQYLRDQSESKLAINEGRLQLLSGRLVYTDSGSFQVEVDADGRDTQTYKSRGLLGTSGLVIGQPSIQSGTFPFPIMSKNDKVSISIVNDSYMPSAFQSAEWTATAAVLSRRM
jgi:hypothetical protein